MTVIHHLLKHRQGAILAAALVLGLVVVPACKAEPAPVPVQLASAPSNAATTHLEHLAETGRFDEVLSRLKSDYAEFHNEPVTELISDLERFDHREAERRAERRQAYDEALGKVAADLEKGHVEEAVIAAIDAHSLADEPPAVLTEPAVQQAVAQAEARATAAEASGDWVEALSFYRALDLLYDDYATYRDEVKRVAKHVQVLQLYVPEKLQELYRVQAERRAAQKAERDGEALEADNPDDPTAPPIIEVEDWRVRLGDVDASMLRQTLSHAARQHVESSGYASLMRGALDSLLVMLDTPDLAATFPAFENREQHQAFRSEIARMRKGLEGQATLNFIDTAQMITKVLELNQRTLKLPEQVVVFELTEGATGTLDDFSSVIWPAEREQFARSTQGKFYGVGIQIKRENNQLTVVTPLPGTPALEAGIQAGDVIATVDGKDTSVWTLDKAVREITGPEGTDVCLGIRRTGEEDLKEFILTRAEIEIESIRGWKHTEDGGWDYWIDPDQRIGYVRLSQFIPQTADDLDAAIASLQKDGPINGLILDLRFNPGGLLSSAVDVVDRFIREGPIVYTVDATGNKQNPSRANGALTYPDFPVVVLINQGSASASEIVSGALQDYGRALIVGTRSFGKGSVQDLFSLAHGRAYLKLTTQYYMLPLGRIIHRKPDATEWGVTPDLIVEMTNEQVADSLEYRQEVDILRDAAVAAAAAGDDEAPKTPEGILEGGVDPQLSAGLLVLQTRQVAREIAMAQAQAQASKPTQAATP